MTAAQRLPLVSVEDYLAAEDQSDIRHGYTGGYVQAMAGGKTSHNRVKTNVFAALHKRLEGKPCEPFDSDMKVRLFTAGLPRFYSPDAMAVCEANGPDTVYQYLPVIIFEVLSESTRRQDCHEKRDAYLDDSVAESLPTRGSNEAKVSVYRRQAVGTGLDAFEAQPYTGREAVIPLDEIEVELPLTEVYERVEFNA